MPDEEKTNRIIARMEMDYIPNAAVANEQAIRNALEHIAFHIGRIDKKLSDLEKAVTVIAKRT